MSRGDTPIPDVAWKTHKNKALLKILLTYRGRILTKDQLIEWLWPGFAPDAGGRNLRVAISQLRRVLEPDLPRPVQSSYILTTEAGYAWNMQADYWLDAEEFASGCAEMRVDPTAGDLRDQTAGAERTRALYRGDYVPEDRYADWATAERERLRELYFALLARLAEAYALQGRYQLAVAACREVLAADRCRESVWCQLMLYHFHAGDQALALRAFEECRQVLAEELGVEPLAETAALAGQIRRRQLTGEQPYPPPTTIERLRRLPVSLGRLPFVGRDAELAWLVDHLGRAGAGQGRVVLLEGEAGAGKTRLAEELLRHARQGGVTIVEGGCREEGSVPYQPLVDALRLVPGLPRHSANLPASSLAAVVGLLPELRLTHTSLPDLPPLPPEQEKARLLEALTQLLLALGTASRQNSPLAESVSAADALLLFLDDLHWADSSTLAFLEYFAGRILRAPVLVLGTFRSEEVATGEDDSLARLLLGLKRRKAMHRLTVEPLASQAVIQLLQKMSASAEQGAALGRMLHRETEGNPLYLVSMLQALFEEGRLTVDDTGGWSAAVPEAPDRDTVAMPATMQELILRRLNRLEPAERQVLEAAAVSGREFHFPVLSRMRAWRADVLLDHLDQLAGALLIRERKGQSYAFSHDRIRQIVYQSIAEEKRCWLHGRAGDALEAIHAERLDEVAGTLARHFQQARRPAQAWAYRLRAGWHALRLYAIAEAMDHYRAALALVGQDGFQPPAEALREAHERLGDLYETVGQYMPAREHLAAARWHADAPADRVRLLYKLAHSHDRQGLAGPSRELLRGAVEEIDRLGVAQVGHLETARAYARWAIMGSGEHGESGSEHYATQAVSILEQHCPRILHGAATAPWAEYDAVHSVLINAGETFRHWKRWLEAAELYQQSLVVAERQAEPNGIGYSCHNLGDVTLARGDFAGARALYERAGEAWAKAGQTWPQMVNHTHCGLAWACEGRWEEAKACLEQARAAGEQTDPTGWLAEVYLWLSLAGLYCTGDERQARVCRERAATVAEAAGQVVPEDLWHLALSAAEARAGRLEVAWEHYSQVQALWEQTSGERAIFGRWILQQCEPPALPAG